MELEPLDFDPFPAAAGTAPKPAPTLEPIDFDPFPVAASQPEPQGWYESTAQTARDAISNTAIGRGFTAGMLKENPDNLGNAVEGFGHLAGSTWAIDQGKAIQDWAKTAGGVSKQGAGVLDSDSLDSFLTNVGETFGSGVASTVPSVVAGLGGAAVGSVAGPVGAIGGGVVGAGSASYVQSFGELYGALKEAGVDPQRAAELSKYGAVPIASLDMIGLGGMAKPFIGEARREIVHGLARRIATEAAKGATTEGITEAAQEFLKDATVTYETGRPLFTAERAKGWAEAGIGGALVGGAVDAGAGFRRPEMRRDPNAPDPALPPPKPGDIESPIPTADIQRGRAMMDALIEGRMEEAMGLGRPGQPPAPADPAPAPAAPMPEPAAPRGYEPLYDDEDPELQVGWINPRTGDVRRLEQGGSDAANLRPDLADRAGAAPALGAGRLPGDQDGANGDAQPAGTEAAPALPTAPSVVPGNADRGLNFDDLLPSRPTAADVRPVGVGGKATGGLVAPITGKVVQVRRDDGGTTSGTVVGVRDDGKVEVKGDLGGKVAVAPEAIVDTAPAPVAAAQKKPKTWDETIPTGPVAKDEPPLAENAFRLYRGEGGVMMGSVNGGRWFTTSRQKAERFAEGGGRVVYVDIDLTDRRTLMGLGQGAGGADEVLTDMPSILKAVKPLAATTPAPAETKIERAKRRAREMVAEGKTTGDIQRTLRAEGASNVEVTAATREAGRAQAKPPENTPEIAPKSENPPAAKPKNPKLVPVSKRTKEEPPRRTIGLNRFGQPVLEDERGVRSYVADGIRMTESVAIAPDGSVSINTGRRSESFKTKDEVDRETSGENARPLADRIADFKRDGRTWAEVLYELGYRGRSTDEQNEILRLWNRGKTGEAQARPQPKSPAKVREDALATGAPPVEDDRERQRQENIRALDERAMIPDGFELGAVRKLDKFDVSGTTRTVGDFKAIVRRVAPFGTFDGYGQTREEAIKDALRQAQSFRSTKETAQEPKEPAAPDPAPAPKPEKPAGPARELAERYRDLLLAGEKFNILRARKEAEPIIGGGRITSDAAAAKVVEEQMEAGIVMAARRIAAEQSDPGAAYERLVDLYRRQPLLSTRTSSSVERQAYSTPAPLAYLASRLAAIKGGGVVYEPSAGNGMLLIEARPADIRANEIDADRLANLRLVLGEDARINQGDATAYAPPGRVARVIANPPFGKVRDQERDQNRTWDVDGLRTPEIDHAISWKALDAMADDGRAVLIIGGMQGSVDERRQGYRSDNVRAFYKKLYEAYNVVDHFTVDGKLYERQGAGWPVDVIVIDGRGRSARDMPMKTPPDVFASWEALKGKLNADRVDTAGQRDGAGERPAPGPAAQEPDAEGIQARPGGSDRPAGGEGGSGDGAGVAPEVRGDGETVGQTGAGTPLGGRPPRRKQRLADQPSGDPGVPGAPVGDQGRAGDTGGAGGGDAGGVPVGRVPGTRDDVSAAFDQVFDEIFGATEPAPESKPARAPRGPRAPATPRPAGEAAASAVKNTVMSLDDMTAGLAALFGGNKLGSGPTFDEETYAKAKPMFQAALVHFKAAGRDVVDVMRALMRHLTEVAKFTREMIVSMRPYIERFVADQANPAATETATAPEPAKAAPKRAENTEAETSFQVRYEPTSKAQFAVGTLVPRNMQTAMSRALTALSERVGDIDTFVADRLGYSRAELLGSDDRAGYFSAEQVDALALAIDNVERGGAFIIGDQTGVGKGRFVAAMLRYALQQNRTPVFVTKDPGLYADMVRDLRDIGMPNIASRVLVTNNGLRNEKAIPLSEDATDVLTSLSDSKQAAAMQSIVSNGSLPDGYEMLFTTYSQLQYGPKGAMYPRQNAVLSLAPNAMIVLDESHEAGGTDAKKIDPETGEQIPTRADFVRSALAQANGVVYSSATYAKNPTVMSLYFKTDLSQAVENIEDLGTTIEAGGVPLQQVIANMLVEGGQYARRERSYEGVEIQLDQLPTNRDMAERASSALRDIFTLDTEFMEGVRQSYIDEMEGEGMKGGKDAAVGESGASGIGFAQVMHNVVAQMLLAVKAPAVVTKAVELAKGGEKPIIALSNTNEAILTDYIEEENLKTGDRADLTFNTILERYLRRLRRITLKDANKRKTIIYLTDADIVIHGGEDALARFRAVERAIRTMDLSEMPASPVDYILDRLNAAGVKADEITGRGTILRNGVVTARKASSAEKKKVMNAYNSGALDALVINRSGSTGFSMHATGKKGNDGKPRHMILLQPDPNIDVFMQMLGRIHRTGQIKLPRYTLAVSDLAVEKRSAAVLMRKMASLNANTTASKRSAVSLDVTDFMNKYGDEVVADFLLDNPEIANITDTRARSSSDGEPSNDGLAARLTGRLAILPAQQVAEIYEQIETAYTEYVESLDRLGMNALEAKTLDLDARTISRETLVPEKDGDGPFAAGAEIETVDVKKLGKAMTWDEVQAEVKRALGGQRSRDIVDDQAAALRAKMPGFLKSIDEGAQRAQKALTEAKSEKQKEKAERAVASWESAREEAEARLRTIELWIDRLAIGSPHTLTVATSEDSQTVVQAVSLGVDIKKVRGNPTAASAMTVRFAIADTSREVRVPLSKLLGENPRYLIGLVTEDDVRAAFDAGGQEAREERQIITGNIVSGFAQFKRGQIVMFTDNEGNRRQGIMLPREFNARAEIARRPVEFTSAEQIATFLKAEPGRRMVKTPDSVMAITYEGWAFNIAVNTKGGKPYYLLKAVRDITGDFQQRKGQKTYQVRIPETKLAAVIPAYQDNLGAKFVTTAHKDEARSIVGADDPRQFSQASPAGWDMVDADPAPRLSQADLDEIGEIIARVSGLETFRRAETIPIPANSPGAKAWGRTEAGRASAFYSGVSDTVTIALDMPEGAGRRVAYHEAFHRLQRLYLTAKELAVLLAEGDRLRAIIAASIERGRAVANRMAQSEVEAEAFSLYTVAKERGGQAVTGFPLRVRMAFAKIDRIVRAVRNWLNGRGYQTYEDVFERAAEGRTALRTARGITGTTVMDDFSMIDDTDTEEDTDLDFGAARRSMGQALFARNATLLQRVRAATNWDAVSETMDRWRYAVQDIVIDLKQVQREIVEVLGPLTESQNPYLAYELSESRAGPRLEALHKNMVSPMLARMKAAGISIEDLGEYLYAKHAPERNARIAEINPKIPEGGSGMTDEEAASIVDRVESGPKARDYARLASLVYEINDFALQIRLEAGLLSEEQADAWRQSYEFYVPLRGFAEMDPEAFEDRPNLGGSGVNVRGKESQRALGRESRAADIVAHAIMQAQEAIARAERNKVGQALYELATAAPNKDFWRADPVKTKAVWNKKLQQVVYQRVHALSRTEEDHTVFLKIDGQEHRVSFNMKNPRARRLAEGMRRLKGKDWGAVVRTFGMINRYLSTVNTTLSPEFIITNAFKDLQTAMVNIGQHDVEGIRKRTLKHFGSVWKGLIRLKSPQQRDEWRGWYDEFIASGGRTYWNDVESVQEIARRLEAEINPSNSLGARSWRGAKSVFKVIETANNNVENAIRLAAFRAAREGGMSPAMAASLAKNLTVNFNRRGAYGPLINSLYLFFNAGIQGTAVILGAMRSPKVRKIVGGIVATGAIVALFNSLAGDDDEDGEPFYDKIPNETRQKNIIIMIPGSGGRYAKIAMPWGYNAFYSLGRVSMEAAFGRKPLDAAADAMVGFLDAFNPIGGAQNLLKIVSPTIIDPIVELYANRDFADRPIAPDKKAFGAEVPNAQRYWNSVSPLWRLVTDSLTTASGGDRVRPGAIDLSPEWLEYLFGVATGSAGQFVSRTVGLVGKMADPTSDWSVNDVPFARRVLGGKAPWVDKAAFYERLHDVEQQKAYLKGYVGAGDAEGRDAVLAESRNKLALEKAAHAAQKGVADIRRARDAAWKAKDRGQMTADEYKERMTTLKERETAIVTRFNTIWMERIEKARPD